MSQAAKAEAIRGKALVLGDHVNADVLHPSSFFSLDDGKVRSGFLRAADPERRDALVEGQPIIVVAGVNFGCGSSRETTVRAFQLAGVRAVVALSFGRLFQRNLLNVGLEAFELTGGGGTPVQDGDSIEISPDRSGLLHESSGSIQPLRPRDPYFDAIAHAGGLLEFLGADRA